MTHAGIGLPADIVTDAVALHEAGRSAEAEALLHQAMAADDEAPLPPYLLGRILVDRDRLAEAAPLLERARMLAPLSPDVVLSLARAYARLGRPGDAVQVLARVASDGNADRAGRGRVASALRDALAQAGQHAYDAGAYGDAAGHYAILAGLAPDLPAAWSSLEAALGRTAAEGGEGALHAAMASSARGLEWGRGLADTLQPHAQLEDTRTGHRRVWLPRRASAWWPQDAQDGAPIGPGDARASLSKLNHDVEQLEYLQRQGTLPSGVEAYLPRMRALRDQLAATGRAPGKPLTLTPQQLEPVAAVFNRIIRLAEPRLQSEPALDPHTDWNRIQRDYQARQPGFVVVDRLLSPWALAELRRYCLESTFWFGVDHEGGYLGAYVTEGFDHDLLFRVAAELQQALPAVLGNHVLRQVWAFKYDQRLKGIAPHADDAAVNVNLWLAPDDACPDPDGGGLVVYPVSVPKDWAYADYNTHNPRLDAFIRDSGVQPLRIGHRQNRAMIFCSDVIHASESVEFRPGYENRRINVTFLFGQRT